MRTLFIGGTKRGWMTLEALLAAGVEVVGVISLEQDAHETERYEGPIRALAQARGIPLFETKWMKDRDYSALLRHDLRPDIAIAVGVRILFPSEIFQVPPKGCVGVHDSLLPQYRGFAPLNWAILNGEKECGVTLFYVSEAMDAGDIIGQRSVPIGPLDTAPQVYERICYETVRLILDSLPGLAAGTAPRIPQDERAATFTCSRTPADGWIDWAAPTLAIHNRIRALTHPYPGAFTWWHSERLLIWSARPLEHAPTYVGRIPGRVVAVSPTAGFVDVLTGDGVLRVLEVGHAGRRVAAAQVVKSVRATLGFRPVDWAEQAEKTGKSDS